MSIIHMKYEHDLLIFFFFSSVWSTISSRKYHLTHLVNVWVKWVVFDLNRTELFWLFSSDRRNIALLFSLPEQLCKKVRTQCENSMRSEAVFALWEEETGTPAESSCGCFVSILLVINGMNSALCGWIVAHARPGWCCYISTETCRVFT